ncbi:phytase [Rheinheimera sp.]|uniref:phytase n=1 Tax=Rheinheimera sp. TaxID=1869214 RepID=UPI00307E0CB7
MTVLSHKLTLLAALGLSACATATTAPAVQLSTAEFRVLPGNEAVQLLDHQGKTIGQWAGRFERFKLLQGPQQSWFAAVDTETNQVLVGQKEANQPARILQQTSTQLVVDDLCWYYSQANQQLSLFLIGDRGNGEQWLLAQDGKWLEKALPVRSLNLPTNASACAVDQAKGLLYLAEGDTALWAYSAELEQAEDRQLIDVRAPKGHLSGEIKALELTAEGDLLALHAEPAVLLRYQAGALDQAPVRQTLQLEEPEVLQLTQQGLSAGASASTLSQLNSTDKAWQMQSSSVTPAFYQLSPTLETAAVSYRGDAIDDPAVWQHPSDPAKSLVLATDKRAGLAVYSMQGEQQQFLPVGRVNNVDLRYGFRYQGQTLALAAASTRADNGIQLFGIGAEGKVSTLARIQTGLTDIYGLCMYQPVGSKQFYVFANSKDGTVAQYQVTAAGKTLSGKLVRSLKVPSQPEGCVADDQHHRLYVGEEDVGIWHFDARATASTAGELVIKADGNMLVADVEGLALWQADQPYLLVSSQGNDSYVLYQATAPYQAVLRFRIRLNPELGIDGSSETDGLELTTLNLGPGFEQGAILVQDGRNRMPEQGQNLKLVPLEQLQSLLNSLKPSASDKHK